MPASSSTKGAIVVVGAARSGTGVLVEFDGGAVDSAVGFASISSSLFAGGETDVVVVVVVVVEVSVDETSSVEIASGQFDPPETPLA